MSKGFTLVELLITVAVISVLTGSLYSIINTRAHSRRVTDGIIRENMTKTVEGLETQYTIEKLYPTDTNLDGTPENITAYFVQGWLNGKPVGAIYTYWVNASRTAIGIVSTLNSGRVLKYRTEWNQVRECAGGTVASDVLCP